MIKGPSYVQDMDRGILRSQLRNRCRIQWRKKPCPLKVTQIKWPKDIISYQRWMTWVNEWQCPVYSIPIVLRTWIIFSNGKLYIIIVHVKPDTVLDYWSTQLHLQLPRTTFLSLSIRPSLSKWPFSWPSRFHSVWRALYNVILVLVPFYL